MRPGGHYAVFKFGWTLRLNCPGDLGGLCGLLVALCALLNSDEHPPSLIDDVMRRRVYSQQR